MKTSTRTMAVISVPSTRHSAIRHPNRSVSSASSGRKTSCPVAVLAVSMPTTRPRRWTNQRVATVAPSTRAVIPVPRPTTIPHSRMSCHTSVIASEPTSPAMMNSRAALTTRLMPKRFMNAAANGPIRPNSSSRMARAEEISAFCQPNSRWKGTIMTPGAPTAPAVASMVRKVVPATTQP